MAEYSAQRAENAVKTTAMVENVILEEQWIRSLIQVGHSIKREARNVAAELEEECERKKARIDEQEASVNVREVEVTEREKN